MNGIIYALNFSKHGGSTKQSTTLSVLAKLTVIIAGWHIVENPGCGPSFSSRPSRVNDVNSALQLNL